MKLFTASVSCSPALILFLLTPIFHHLQYLRTPGCWWVKAESLTGVNVRHPHLWFVMGEWCVVAEEHTFVTEIIHTFYKKEMRKRRA